jgi:hypothetical protein
VTPAATPTPRILYVHDDLSDQLAARGDRGPEIALGRALLDLLRRHPERVVILSLARQLDGVISQGDRMPFAIAVGIGGAGARVAAQLHSRTGWFPTIRRVDVWREEDGRGGYVLAAPAPIETQLGSIGAETPSLAVVDDTIFSGLTMRSVLTALPHPLHARTHAFCLRAVAESLADVARLAPVTAGFTAAGRILDDVSFINASGLVRRGAIRPVGEQPLAFFERPEWMEAWFPGYHDEVLALCRELNARLEKPSASGARAM